MAQQGKAGQGKAGNGRAVHDSEGGVMTEIRRITKARGVAGALVFSAFVTYPGEGESVVTFHGSVYGGPVVMETPAAGQVFVTDPGRFGEFGESWVRRFFEDA